jgi:hypothetical protein
MSGHCRLAQKSKHREASNRQNFATKRLLDIRDCPRCLKSRRATRENRESLLRGVQQVLDIRHNSWNEVSN